MNSRKAMATAACTASVLARSRTGMLSARKRHHGAEEGEDQDPEQHRALVVPPHAGDLVDERLRRMRVLDHVQHGKVGGRHRRSSAPGRRRRCSRKRRGRHRPDDISTGSLARAPHSGTTNWMRENPSASASAKCPASTNTRAPPSYCVFCEALASPCQWPWLFRVSATSRGM